MEEGFKLIYTIRVRGHLDCRWAGWFDGLSISLEENGETLISGPGLDQAALYGLLKKVRDLGLTLLAVTCLEAGPEDAPE